MVMSAPCKRSSGGTFVGTVLQVRCRIIQGLLNILGLKLRIVPEEVGSVRIQRYSFHNSPHRKAHVANARLTIHLVRIPGYAIETLHRIHFRTLPAVTDALIAHYQQK
jgi:hypothetical protein